MVDLTGCHQRFAQACLQLFHSLFIVLFAMQLWSSCVVQSTKVLHNAIISSAKTNVCSTQHIHRKYWMSSECRGGKEHNHKTTRKQDTFLATLPHYFYNCHLGWALSGKEEIKLWYVCACSKCVHAWIHRNNWIRSDRWYLALFPACSHGNVLGGTKGVLVARCALGGAGNEARRC